MMKLQFLALVFSAFAENPTEAVNLLQLASHKHSGSSLWQKHSGSKKKKKKCKAPCKRCMAEYAKIPALPSPKKSKPDNRKAGNLAKTLHDLNFATVKANDITGSGLVFGGVAALGGKSVDAVITATDYTAAVPSKTGIRGKLGNVNLGSNVEATFTMDFVDADTQEPVELGEFLFSVFDLDIGGGKEEAQETLTISGFSRYYLLPKDAGGQLIVKKKGGGEVSFSGSGVGSESDNPVDPMVLDAVQAQRAVNFRFAAGKKSISWRYKVSETSNDGRNFQFGGMTNLYFCKAPKVNLDFSFATLVRSNLGNAGPQFDEAEGVRYHKIAVVEDQIIDLEINALDDYQAADPLKTGKSGLFGQINMGAPVSAEKAAQNAKAKMQHKTTTGVLQREFTGKTNFKFSLYVSGTNELFTPEWLYFSMYDLDNGNNMTMCPPKFQESFTVDHISNFELAEGTTIVGEVKDEKYEFRSTFWSGGDNNPEGPLDLDEKSLPHAVTFTYRDTAQWTVGFGIGPPSAWSGRNFMFAGKSSTAACEQNSYKDVENIENVKEVEDPDNDEVEDAEDKLQKLGVKALTR